MSNWAAYKEKEIGLPVVKRAKHGIHFDAGKGLVQAEFVGKPCHYFDGKEYKAIDTRPLLRKDGTFGCAHSDVIIHTDGTVQVGDYTQRAALIYPGKISVDGDRIARPFSGGVQYMYITEDGYRQEIVLEKMPDLRKVSALVDTVKGVLPTKYTASSLSLKDSSTAELSDFVQVDSKSLASVLEAAKYPVVIDPDFSGTSTGDSYIIKNLNTNNYGANNPLRLGVATLGISHYRGLFKWDVSSIDSGVTVSASSITLNCSAATDNTKTSYVKVYRLLRAWVESEVTWDIYSTGNNWGAAGGFDSSDCEQTEIGSFDALDVGSYQFSITASKVQEWISGALSNNGILAKDQETLANSYKRYDTKEDGTAGDRPVLSVTYTAGTFIPVNMMANTQNLTAGMRG
jgi:hypothetical protein